MRRLGGLSSRELSLYSGLPRRLKHSVLLKAHSTIIFKGLREYWITWFTRLYNT